MERSGGTQELSADRANEILKHLGEIGVRGAASAEFLQRNKTYPLVQSLVGDA